MPALEAETAAPPAETSAPAPSEELLRELQSLVQRNTRRWKLLIMLEMVAVLVAAPLGYLWVVFSLDILVHLPRWGRVATSALFFAVLAVLGRWVWRRWKAVRLTEDEVALAIERQTPGTSNQIINSLQIGRAGGSEHSLAVLRENHASLQRIHLRQAAKLRPALVRLAAAAVVLGIGVWFYLFKQAHFTNAASRLFQPFSQIAPLYRTMLEVDPGDAQAAPGSTVKIRIKIQGEHPGRVAVQQFVGDTRSSEQVPVPAGADIVEYTFRNLQRSLTYTVTGGDYTTPIFNIEVPVPPQVNLVRATMHLPEYTHLPPQKVEAHGGDMQALRGTRAEVHFVLDQPADTATLLLEDSAAKDAPAGTSREVPLTRVNPTEFSGEILFKEVAGYQVRVQRGKQAPGPSVRYGLRVVPDEPPQLTLTGLDRQTEAQLGSELPLKISATDDYGLIEVGLFARKITGQAKARASDADWQAVAHWPQPNFNREVKLDHALVVAALGAVEDEKIEIALRGRDADPGKGTAWTAGESFTLLIGGEGTIFQVLYEQILQSEADLKRIITLQQDGVTHAAEWVQKMDPASGMRWDDQKNLDALTAAMKDQAKAQEQLRQTSGAVARDFVSATGNLRFSLGMLADTEMVRAIRVLEGVPAKDDPQGKRAALAEVRFTEERTIRSLNEILEQYVQFRQNWELANMTPYVKMLADRQAALRDESTANADKGAQPVAAKSASQRQAKLLALSGLAQTALAGMGERVSRVDEPLGQAYSAASKAFEASGINAAMQQAVAELAPGHWPTATPAQAKAATALAQLHAQLKKAVAEAMARAMKDAEQKQSALAAQKELGKLMPGSEIATEKFRQDLANISQVVEMRETIAGKKNGAEGGDKDALPPVSEELAAAMKTVENSNRPDLNTLRLGTRAEETKKLSANDGLRPNEMIAPLVPDKIEDLVGKLLDEADEMGDKFDSLTVNSGLISADPGEVGKLAGRMNSSGATSTTGNKKPPTANVGGMSATGRQGARSYGKVAGSESPNMRGRDKVQEGQFAAPDQDGVLKEKKTDDMQPDTATGIGGKRVDSDKTKFSLSDKGEWDDKFANRMQKPQEVNTIVERQGKPLDPRVAALLRDMDGNQKQLIERANALRKELKNLYLPTDHLDDLIAQLNQNLERLRENPNPETFRTHQELLDRLRSEARVFNGAQAGFQPSLPRQQQVRGRILDEPASPPIPGYENEVKEYYRKLAIP